MDRDYAEGNNEKLIIHTLEKLRLLVLSGGVDTFCYGYTWEYDNNPANDDEIHSLMMLNSIGAIKINRGLDELIDTGGNPLDYAERPDSFGDNNDNFKFITNQMKTRTILKDFNASKYEKICENYSLEPYTESYLVYFTLDKNTPCVYFPKNTPHFFRTLKSATPLNILEACYNKRNKIIKRDELKKLKKIESSKTSLRQYFKDSPLFNQDNGVLKPFVDINSEYIEIKPAIKTTKKDLDRMLKLANN